MRWSEVPIRALPLLALALVCCVGRLLPREQLPDDAIAILYWTPEQARRRVERIEAATAPRAPREGVARLEDLSLLLGRRPDAAGSETLAGRLTFLDPRSGEIEVVEGAYRGSRPLAWSRDRTRLLFASSQFEGRWQLFELERRSGDVHRVTRGPATYPEGAYGPDGRLAYTQVRSVRGRFESRIAITEPGGLAPRVVSDGPVDHTPAWSPDGKTLVYVKSRASGHARIVARAPALDGETQVLARGRDPVFSPDGQWIVYSARRHERSQLWRMRPDGSARAPIGTGRFDERWPAVSPGGRFVAFVAESNNRRQIHVRRFDGAAERILLSTGDGDRPKW